MGVLDNVTNRKYLGVKLSPEERRAVLDDLFVFGKDNQDAFLRRVAFLLIISTIIACCGLMANSAAVVIGAMLVAPMMTPVMAAAAAITLGWRLRLYKALLLAVVMAFAAVLISAFFAWLSPDLIKIPGEVLARTKPTFYDLVIALAAGSGGAYTLTRKESSAIPGVAMAVALLPPLASTGILLVFKEPELALKAFVLFFTNLAAMVFSASVTFLFIGVTPKRSSKTSSRKTRNYMLSFFVLVFGISVPLYFYSQDVWYDALYKANRSSELQGWLIENQFIIDDVKIDKNTQTLSLKLLGPYPPLSIEFLYAEIAKYREKEWNRSDPFKIDVLWVQTARFGWPPERKTKMEQHELFQDISAKYIGRNWHWRGTQYADGVWLRPDKGKNYQIISNGNMTVDIKTNCIKTQGDLILNQKNFQVSLNKIVTKQCDTYGIDQKFINDLNQVIQLRVVDDTLTLQLGNNAGIMHFYSKQD